MEKEKKGYDTPKVELIKIDDTDLILTSLGGQSGHGDVGNGLGNGGGCDHIAGHANSRKTHSNGRNKGC